jgi:hypothetical protein
MSTLVVCACAGKGAGTPGVSMLLPPLPASSTLQNVSATAQPRGKQKLYVTSAGPYFFNVYRLPLHTGEGPRLTETGVNEPVPIVDDGRDLYVGSFDDGTIFTYSLPLSPRSQNVPQAATVSHESYVAPFSGTHLDDPADPPPMNGEVPSGLDFLSGLAVNGKYLYVAGVNVTLGTSEVLEYRLPLVSGETPTGLVTGFSFDFLGIAARNHTLYVASTVAGTVGAYHLPLRSDESPRYTIVTTPQGDGAAGVAVDGDCRHLYVSLYTTGDVYEYRLPYRSGESHKTLDVQSGPSGGLPYGIAVSENHLFVTAGRILSYRLPLSSRKTPDAIVTFPGFAAGVAAGK